MNRLLSRSDIATDALARLASALTLSTPLSPRLLFGARLVASVCLALFVSYFINLENPFWSATTAVIVCQQNLGASLQKGRYRAIGTILGAAVMVTLFSFMPQGREALIVCLALWCGLCGFAAVALRGFASNAAALAGITASIIFVDALADPTAAAHLAILRVSEITIGIAAAGVVMILTAFGVAGRELVGMLHTLGVQLGNGVSATLARGGETEELRLTRRNLARSMAGLDAAIEAAIGESAFIRARAGNLQAMSGQFLDALVAWRNLGGHRWPSDNQADSVRNELVEVLVSLDLAQFDRDPEDMRKRCLAVAAGVRSLPGRTADHWLLANALRDVATALAAIAECIIFLRTGRGRPTPRRLFLPVVADPLHAAVNGLRTFAAVLVTAAFWVTTAWPSGPFAVVFAAIATLIFGVFDDQARAMAKDYAVGAVLMTVVAGMIYCGALPALTGNWQLGSGLVDQSQKMTAAAIQMAEKKVCAHRS